MSTPVEAKSFSSITWLLANPPQYPRNPTHETSNPLVLYIVRVPGSKDVFLTPVRPPTKASISLEAIQSSLYFLHVETPADEIVKQAIEEERVKDEVKATTQHVFRKPLPPTPFSNDPAPNRSMAPPKSYPDYQPPGFGYNNVTQAARFTARGSNIRLRLQNATGVRRRPIGARPQSIQLGDDTTGLGDNDSDIQPRVRGRPNDHANTLHRGFGNPVIYEATSAWTSPFTDDDSTQTDVAVVANPDHNTGTRITLIRRDPASGSQWNVGTISIANQSENTLSIKPVEVELSTPGYGRFNHQFHQSVVSEPIIVTSTERSDDRPTPLPAQPDMQPTTTFKRQVGFRAMPNNHKFLTQNGRAMSDEILANITNGVSKKTRRVLGFTSPWDGTCTFSNGIDGRTIKCRHLLPTNNSTSEISPTPIAELRFNLPWSTVNTRSVNNQALSEPEVIGKSAKEQWRRSVQHLKHASWHPRPTNIELQENQRPKSIGGSQSLSTNYRDGEMDLRLGREKAGGGMKGNSAKLGKLIIEDEGLKMCDLVVGACMGVWWQHYTDGMSF